MPLARNSLVLSLLEDFVRRDGLASFYSLFSACAQGTKRRTLSTTLSRLRREGLVERTGAKKNGLWSVTRKGLRAFRAASVQKDKREMTGFTPSPSDGKIRLVAFDVPERWRKKRDWIRECLAACHFELLQKSVWIGTRPLPEDFIQEIDKRNLGSCVHIVSLSEKGTLEKN